MQGYFANFIKTGNPNGSGLPTWPLGGVGKAEVVQRMRLDEQPRAEAEPRARYGFLERAFTTVQP
jgi:para-nitrobenzyl esterase